MSNSKEHFQCDLSKNPAWGVEMSEKYQCIHYNSRLDVVAIRLKCCNIYYACILCHAYRADHFHMRWSKEEFHEKAILCGHCHTSLTIKDYLKSHPNCPSCRGAFNPGCASHHHLYFEG